MNAEYTLIEPFSVNNAFFNVKGKGRVTTKRYRAWMTQQLWEFKATGPIKMIRGPVFIALFGPRDDRRDLDNCIKAYLDALVKVGAIEDDKYVEALVVQWTEERRGRCVVQTQGVFCAEDAA